MNAAAQARFSETLLLKGKGLVIRLTAGCSVGRLHSKRISSTAEFGGEGTLLNVNEKVLQNRAQVLLSLRHVRLVLAMMNHSVETSCIRS